MMKKWKEETQAIHVDKKLENTPDVSPPLHFSTTYVSKNEDGLVYSRADHMTSNSKQYD
jgi:hypothetical protein